MKIMHQMAALIPAEKGLVSADTKIVSSCQNASCYQPGLVAPPTTDEFPFVKHLEETF